MKKFFIFFCFFLISCNLSLAESYYFKKCKLNEQATGDYLIDLANNVINVTLKTHSGESQEITDDIKLVTENKIFSDIIQSKKNKQFYLQYYLDAESKSVIRQRYIKQLEGGILEPDGPKSKSFCEDVKIGWDQEKVEESAKKTKKKKKIIKTEINLPKCEGGDPTKWKNCLGIFLYDNGHEYEGEYQNGKIVKGTAIYPGGSKYVGNFKNEKPHGEGTFVFPDDSTYYGQFKNGKSNGQGIKTWKDGKEYAGSFKNDLPHGEGTFIYPDGSKYVGGFKNGKRNGQGTITYPNGSTFTGDFANGLEYGKGTCMDQAGSTVECEMLETKKTTITKSKNMKNISIESKKWVKESDRNVVENNLQNKFDTQAKTLCSENGGNYEVHQKRIVVLEVDEKLEYKFIFSRDVIVARLGISGVIECK